MAVLDSALGALLIATWFDAMLLMLEIVQAVFYFTHFPKDAPRLKALVVVLLCMDVVSEMFHNVTVYLYTVTNWGNPEFLLFQHWPVAIFLPTAGVSAILAQSYLIARLWSLSRNWFVVVPLLCLSFASFAGVLSTAIISTLYPALAERHRAVVSSWIWLAGGAAADAGIAFSLVWQLSKAKSRTSYDNTHSILRRLTALAISTGFAPTVLAVASLITFLADQESNVCVGIAFCLGRTYSITALYNLNMRGRLRTDGHVSRSISRSRTSPGNSKGMPQGEQFDLAGISVVRTVHVQDGGPDGHVSFSPVPADQVSAVPYDSGNRLTVHQEAMHSTFARSEHKQSSGLEGDHSLSVIAV